MIVVVDKRESGDGGAREDEDKADVKKKILRPGNQARCPTMEVKFVKQQN